jgi:hypothetical protein
MKIVLFTGLALLGRACSPMSCRRAKRQTGSSGRALAMPQLPSRNSTFDRPGTAAAAGPDRLQPGPIGGFDGTAMAPAAIADCAAGLAAALHSPRMTGAEREVKVTMKLAARLTLGLLLLGVSVQTAMAAGMAAPGSDSCGRGVRLESSDGCERLQRAITRGPDGPVHPAQQPWTFDQGTSAALFEPAPRFLGGKARACRLFSSVCQKQG